MAVATSPSRPTSRSSPSLRGAVLALFVASGAAGLIYQVVWSRELVLVFGNTTQAVATIVTAFMAGLGFGSLVGGRLAGTSRRPLRLYGLVELAVAATAAFLPLAFSGLAELYRGVWPSLVERPGQLAGVRFGLAMAAVAPATFLMGMTLPLLTRYMVRTLDEAGARLGELYAANTIGAMAGTLLGGFVLIELLGLRLTSYLAVALNVVAGLGALALSRRWEAGQVGDDAPATRPERPARPEVPRWFRPRRRAVLAATFVSGFVSLALEVLWTRMLAEGTGASIYIFTTILAIFLFGIALGSLLYRRFSRPEGERLGALGLCLAGIGVLAQATVVLGSGMVGHVPFVVRTVVVLLPATVLMGYAFPLAGRLATPSAEAAGGSVGLLYAANTGGSILGSFGAAFVLAGTLGTNGSILLLGALNLLVGAALFAADPLGRAGPGPAASPESQDRVTDGPAGPGRTGVGRTGVSRGRARVVAAGLAGLAVLGLVASSLDLPVTRTRTENELRRTGLPVTHAEDELATVDTVGGPAKGRRLLVGGVGMTSLTVDTKLMGYLSKALRPDARDFLVIAFGMGGTYRSGLQLGLRTDAVELSPTVPSRMPVYFPDASRFLSHPQGRVIVSDGRNYVRLSRETYDMVAVDPAPPVESAGSVVLYTREFLTEGKARLRPGGVFMLWIPYALPMDDFKEHVRTFAGVFGHVRLVLSPGRHGVFMFGSDAPLDFTEPNVRRVLGAPAALADLNDVPDHPPTDADGWVQVVRRSQWLADDRLRAFVGDGPEITDDRPRSEYFLWRRAFMDDRRYIGQRSLRAAAPR
ncbi:MAG TPA: fused MFS/spermidine synthase [Actinomycetota bacterium]|nr:fused MFS/spermidine synthase [Actinomycetota bacterium]